MIPLHKHPSDLIDGWTSVYQATRYSLNSPTGANGYPEGVVGAFHGFGEIAANYYRSNMVK